MQCTLHTKTLTNLGRPSRMTFRAEHDGNEACVSCSNQYSSSQQTPAEHIRNEYDGSREYLTYLHPADNLVPLLRFPHEYSGRSPGFCENSPTPSRPGRVVLN